MSRLGLLSVGLGAALVVGLGCQGDEGLLLPARQSAELDLDRLTLVARIAHVADSHIMDEESPARFAGAQLFTRAAWRPYGSYSAQLLDGVIRTVNRIHAGGRTIDFLIHAGDACDNAQSNELEWFLGVMDGELIDPLSGPDDRSADARPELSLDPHAPFQAQGLYRAGQHGDLPSIPWYALFGNHDAYALGAFPILESDTGHRTALLPLPGRPGLVLPVRLDPAGSVAYGNVTPGTPGPVPFLNVPGYVEPNPARAYFSKPEFIAALFATTTEPTGHGFADPEDAAGWYSVSPAPGVRLLGLDTTDRAAEFPGRLYQNGALSRAQFAFLQGELDAATQRGELVIVATHHPSSVLQRATGSEVTGAEFRALLNDCPQVVLHLAGHKHRNRVTDQGGYLEIETCSTLDLTQEGRLIEIWRDDADGRLVIAYEMFSHLDDTWPALGDDPLRALREQAQALALGDKGAAARQKQFDPSGTDPRGRPSDRRAMVVLGE